MAEVFGAVVSGLSLAQIIGQVVPAAVKLNKLLDEIKDAPEAITRSLRQLDVFELVLGDVDRYQSMLSDNLGLPPTASLQAAKDNCDLCLRQLRSLLVDLCKQIDCSKSRSRRKLAAAKIVLQKDVLSRYQQQLEEARQILMEAQINTLMIYQLMPVMTRSNPNPNPLLIDAHQPTFSQGVQGQVLPSTQSQPITSLPSTLGLGSSNSLQTMWPNQVGLGAPAFLGSFDFEVPKENGNQDNDQQEDSDQDDEHLPRRRPRRASAFEQEQVLRLHVQFPTWRFHQVWDLIIRRSQSGWATSLDTYRIIPAKSEVWGTARKLMRDGKLAGLGRLIERGDLKPLDFDEGGNNLFYWAFVARNWPACNFLMDKGGTAGEFLFHRLFWGTEGDGTPCNPWSGDDHHLRQIQAFLRRDDQDDQIRTCLLQYFPFPVQSFRQLRPRIWPDARFFARSFSPSRHHLAVSLIGSPNGSRNPNIPRLVREVLSRDVCLCSDLQVDAHACCHVCDAGDVNVLHAIACNIGNSQTLPPSSLPEWRSLVRDALGYKHSLHRIQNHSTPFFDLVMTAVLQYLCEPDPIQKHLRRSLCHCDRVMRMWLRAINDSGIELEEYGRVEQDLLRSKPITRDVGYSPYDVSCGEDDWRYIHLVGFDYGPAMDDWRLLWSEPTDMLVGEFWRLVEHPPCFAMPGSWVEDVCEDD